MKIGNEKRREEGWKARQKLSKKLTKWDFCIT